MIPADKTLCIYLNAEHERMPPSCDRMMMLEAACEAVPDTRCPAPPRPLCPGGGYKGFRHRSSVIRGGGVNTEQTVGCGHSTLDRLQSVTAPHLSL